MVYRSLFAESPSCRKKDRFDKQWISDFQLQVTTAVFIQASGRSRLQDLESLDSSREIHQIIRVLIKLSLSLLRRENVTECIH